MTLSSSALFYRKNKKAREKKKKYDTKYHSTPARKAYRAALGRVRYKMKKNGGIKRNQDVSHTKKKTMVREHYSKNRARNGSGGKNSLK